MRRLAKFLRAPLKTKILYALALVAVAKVRLLMSLHGFEYVNRLKPGRTRPSSFSPLLIAGAVSYVSRFISGASCLTQAAAARLLLAQYGYPSSIRVGVRSGAAGEFLAHAWLVFEGKVILGGTAQSVSEYNVITDVDALSFE